VQSLATPFEVDGKAIIVSYAKNTFSTVWVSNTEMLCWYILIYHYRFFFMSRGYQM
jgi:hypothetical protein